MADGKNPFIVDVPAEQAAPANPFIVKDPAMEGKQMAPDGSVVEKARPISVLDRYLLQFVFDTQPAKKKEYLKQLGYAVDPEDDNRIRPLGDDGDYMQIDPGGFFDVKQYVPENATTEDYMKAAGEVFADVNEGVLDLIQGALIEAVGTGAAAATVLGSGGTATAAAPSARSAGRSLAFNTLEAGKDVIADILLDKDIPTDYKLRAIQTGVQAIAPEAVSEAMRVGGGIVKKAVTGSMNAVKSGVKTALTWGKGNIDDFTFEQIAKNPKNFSPEKLQRADQNIDEFLTKIYGSAKDRKNIAPDSIFQQKLTALEGERAIASKALANSRKADMSLEEVLTPFQSKYDELLATPGKNNQDKQALSWLKEKIGQLKADFNPDNKPMRSVKLPFDQVDDLVKRTQKDVWSKDTGAMPIVRQVIDGSNDSPGLNNVLKQKADAAMKDMPDVSTLYSQIKAQEKQVFDTFERVAPRLNESTARQYIVGGDAAETAAEMGIFNKGGASARQMNMSSAMQDLDQMSGTNMTSELQNLQLRKRVFDSLGDRAAKGSAGILNVAPVTYFATRPFLGDVGAAAVTAGTVAASNPMVGLPIYRGASKVASEIGEKAIPAITQRLTDMATSPTGAAAIAGGAQEVVKPQVESFRDYLFGKTNEDNPFIQ